MAQKYCQQCSMSLMPSLMMCPTCGGRSFGVSPIQNTSPTTTSDTSSVTSRTTLSTLVGSSLISPSLNTQIGIPMKNGSNLNSSENLSSALSQLRLKLLDLTGRNRLINFKPSVGKSLQFVEGQDIAIFEKLVEATSKASITLTGLPEPTRNDWEERNGRIQRPEPRDWAKKLGISIANEIEPIEGSEANLRALLYADDLAKHCRKIEREAQLAIEETGSNMLFLVLGFLEFPDQRVSDKNFSAPLISVPVTLQKKEVAGIQQFSVQYTGDDISENLSLREKLKNDYGITLPELSEEQIDLAAYFAEIQAVIKDQPGFAHLRKVTLCLLSFSNMLLVRDLEAWNYHRLALRLRALPSSCPRRRQSVGRGV